MPETSRTVTWLHLSDLHSCTPESDWDANMVKTELVNDLRRLQIDHGLRPNFIFFTGDAAWGNIGTGEGKTLVDQFKVVKDFFDSVRKAFEPEVPATDLFVVPGNHDVCRKDVSEIDTEWLDRQKSLDKIIKQVKEGKNDAKRWMNRLSDFHDFLSSSGYSHLLEDPSRLMYATCRNVGNARVGILGFNTAWSCCRDGEKAKLWWAGKWQIGQLRSKVEGTTFNIGLLHHPPNWFGELEDPSSGRELEMLCKFVLHGHEHDMWIHENVHGHTRISAAACYDRSDRDNGYNLVRLNLESGDGEVWLRHFYKESGRWDKRHVPERTPNNDGVWPLKHLKWLQAESPTVLREQAPPVYSEPQAKPMFEKPLYGNPPFSGSIMGQSAVPSEPMRGYLRRETSTIAYPSIGILMSSGTRPDIVMRPIVPESVVWPEKPLFEKTPILQELYTPEQVRDHFLPMPSVTQHLDDWLRCKRDLLFLGLPFCGKTSFLTYLAVEAARNKKVTALPILLRPREDLPAEAVEAAIVDLKRRLERIKVETGNRQMLLLLDNVHNPVHCEIASHLMASPRPWRVWGAARSREFARLEEGEMKSPWTEANVIQNACSLVGKSEAEWMMEQIFKPCLHFNEKEHLEEQILEAIEAAGQVPTRFLIQVWGLIKEDKADVDTAYRDLIRNLPKDIDAVVQSLMPHSFPGMKALVITDYLRNPPWEVLEFVLAAVDEHGQKLAEDTITQLRRTSSLVPDSEQSFRATMYDPIREVIRCEGNLPKAFKTQIWNALLSYLRLRNDVEPEISLPLSEYWAEIAQHARDSGQSEARIACAERALTHAEGDSQVEALYELGLARLGINDADVVQAHHEMTKACDLADQVGEKTKNAAYANAIWALYHPSQDTEAFEQRVSRLIYAENICKNLGEDSDVAFIAEHTARLLLAGPKKDATTALRHAREAVKARERLGNPAKIGVARMIFAQCLHSQMEPNWEEAIKAYQESLDCLTEDTDKATRATAFYYLAQCLHSQTEPNWEEAYTSSKQSIELRLEEARKSDAVQVLPQLVWLCPKCAQPPWEEAIEFCRTALGMLTEDTDKATRATVFYYLAQCLHSQTEPNWEEAIKAYQESLDCLTEDTDKATRATAFYYLAQCLHSQTEPNWEEAIKAYQESLDCLTEDTDKATRATAFYYLAQCLHSQTEPNWEEAYTSSKQSIELRLEEARKSDAVQVLPQLVWLCPKCAQPPWEEAIEFCRTALGMLTEDTDKATRATVFYYLAQCLHSQTEPNWEEAVSAAKKSVDLSKKLEKSSNLEYAMVTLASALEDQPTPDMPGAISVWKETCQEFPCVNNTLGLVMSLDRSGHFEDADAWVKTIESSELGGETQEPDSPLARRRQAYLCLRRNEL